jgi:hypothetical protein
MQKTGWSQAGLCRSTGTVNTTVKYVANVTYVCEVSLLGTADLGFWKDRLQRESLVPAKSGGKAQMLIVVADLKFLGVRFQEMSFSVLVSWQEQGITREGAYLVQAFNKSVTEQRTFSGSPRFTLSLAAMGHPRGCHPLEIEDLLAC